jgi:predicted SprT family Zn-dependent metalloprotease
MTVDEIPHVATYLLRQHGLYEQGWRFAWDRGLRRAGCCKHRLKQVTLSRHYVELNVADKLTDVLDTILHEIAHALTPGHHHDAVWKAKCVEVGAEPKRCYNSDKVVMPKGRFVANCPSCSREFRRHKRFKNHDRGAWSYCVACGPERGRLAYRDTAAALVPSPTVASIDTPPAPKRVR